MSCPSSSRLFCVFGVIFLLILAANSEKNVEKQDKPKEKEAWKKKSVLDYTDADLERLYDQWEEEDEPLEEDELPEWKREQPKIDISKFDPKNPESILKESKKGRSLMMFATVSGNPSDKETETITAIWQSSLFNANVELQRFVVGTDRVIFMLKDGAKAWEIKDYLIQQDRCSEVSIEGQTYPGKGADKQKSEEESKPDKKPTKDTVKKVPSDSDSNKSKKQDKDNKKKTEL